MKALLFRGASQPIQVTNVPKPDINKGQVLIRVKYAALNHLDLLIMRKVEDVTNGSVILGSDGAGVIEAVGEGVNKLFVGQEVLINPALNWGDELKAHGPDFEILGYPDNGTFAEYIVIDQKQVFPKPSHLTLQEAAAIPMAGLTAYRVLFTRGKLEKGQNVLVTGAGGGVGQFLLQFAIAAGANVYVTSGSNEKLAFMSRQGVIKGFNYKDETWANAAKAAVPDGFDLIVDSAGGEAFLSLIDLTKTGGTIVIFGRTAGNIPPIYPGLLYNKQINILATIMGSSSEFGSMLNFYETNRIRPVIDQTFSLDEYDHAFRKMEEGKHLGKILFEIQD